VTAHLHPVGDVRQSRNCRIGEDRVNGNKSFQTETLRTDRSSCSM